MATPQFPVFAQMAAPTPISVLFRVWGTSTENWRSTGLGARCGLPFLPRVPSQRFPTSLTQVREPWKTGSE